MDQKLLYTAPKVETFEVQFQGVICQSPNPTMLMLMTDWGVDNAAGASLTEDFGYDL